MKRRRRILALCGALPLMGSALAQLPPTLVSDWVSGAGSIQRYDATTGQYLGTFGAGFVSGPLGIAYGPNGDVLVASYSSDRITRFDAVTGQYKGQFGTGFFSNAEGLAMGPDNLVYVASNGTNNVVRFDPVTGQYKGTLGAGFVNGPAGVRFGPDGTLYVMSFSGGNVTRFVPQTGQYKGQFGAGFLSSPWDAEFGADGYLHVTSVGGPHVMRFNAATGQYAGVYGTGFVNGAVGITQAPNQMMNVGSLDFGWVTRLQTNGKYEGYYGWTFLQSPYFLQAAPMARGNIDLQDWVGDTTLITATIEIRKAGTTTPIRTLTTQLTSSGNFTIPATLNGTFDIGIKATHWLRKTLTNVFIPSSGRVGLNVSLINGDCDGDNTVTVFDYDLLSTAFDSNLGDPGYDPNADLDGDKSVTVFDYDILSTNFDLSGDN